MKNKNIVDNACNLQIDELKKINKQLISKDVLVKSSCLSISRLPKSVCFHGQMSNKVLKESWSDLENTITEKSVHQKKIMENNI